MVFHEVFHACDVARIRTNDSLVARATWETPLFHDKRSDEVSFTLGELMAAPAPHLAKGAAIFRYATLLRSLGSVSVVQTKAELAMVVADVDGAGAGADADLAEIRELLLKLDASLGQ